MSKYGVENPTLSLNDWIDLSDKDPVLVSLSEPTKESKGFMKTSILYSVRTTSKTGTQTVQRSYKDFAAFRSVLQSRFPGSSVPALPPTQAVGKKSEAFVTRRMHMLEFFMNAISQNPFFRADDAYERFGADERAFDRSLAEGERAVKTANSEGVRRWRQALAETEVQSTEKLRSAISKELDMIRAQLKSLRKAAKQQEEKMQALAGTSLELYKSFADYYILERDSIQYLAGAGQFSGASSGSKSREIKMDDLLLEMADKTSQFAAVLKSDIYDAKTFRAVLVDPIRFEMSMVEMWKDHMELISSKTKQLRRARTQVFSTETDIESTEAKISRDGDPKGKLGKQLANLREKVLPKAIALRDSISESLEQHEAGLLGYELPRYRTSRTVRMETLINALSRFHLHGLDELSKIFDGTGSDVRLGRDPKGNIVVTKNESAKQPEDEDSIDEILSLENSANGESKLEPGPNAHIHQRRRKKFSLLRLRSSTRNKPATDAEAVISAIIGDGHRDRSNQMQTAASMHDGVQLRARQNFTATRSDELDINKGEMLLGKRVDDHLWYVTNSKGNAGIVPGKAVDVAGNRSSVNIPESRVLQPKERSSWSKFGLPSPPKSSPPSKPIPPPGLKHRKELANDYDDDVDDDEDTEDEKEEEIKVRDDSSSDEDDEGEELRKEREEEERQRRQQEEEDEEEERERERRRRQEKEEAERKDLRREKEKKERKEKKDKKKKKKAKDKKKEEPRKVSFSNSIQVSQETSDGDEETETIDLLRRSSLARQHRQAAQAKKSSPVSKLGQQGGGNNPMLTAIQGFDKEKLNSSTEEQQAQRKPPPQKKPSTPMEELMQKLQFRDKVE